MKAYTQIASEPVGVHPEIERLGDQLGFDYGRFDDGMNTDARCCLDANTTRVAAGPP